MRPVLQTGQTTVLAPVDGQVQKDVILGRALEADPGIVGRQRLHGVSDMGPIEGASIAWIALPFPLTQNSARLFE